ncbi:MAG: hypothetical protein ABIQ64_01095 [Candidatus Saccharimonadales bacterium]
MQQHSPENGFECRSGCIAAEACVNALSIRALDLVTEGLAASIKDKSSLEATKVVHGDLSSIQTRQDFITKQDAALYDACGLYQLQKDNLTTAAVPIEDMPTLD